MSLPLGETTDGPFVDLHTHSTASDGALPPEAVVAAAKAEGLAVIALTDHDTVDGVEAAYSAGEQLGVRVVRGCELSAYEGKLEVHLLVLHIASTEAIKPRLLEFREQRYERAVKMVQQLNLNGVGVSFEQVLKEADGGVIGRPHVARALVNGGFAHDLRDSFDKFLGANRAGYVAKPRLEASEAIQIAHDAGALAIWAHPGKDGSRERVKRLLAVGLDGLEVRHPSHSVDDVKRLMKFINDYSLVRSGGSDWHGATEGYRTLGNMHVPISWLEEQEARLTARVS